MTQAVEVPSSDSLRAIDVWVVLLYGFFLLHILLLTYPKAKPGELDNLTKLHRPFIGLPVPYGNIQSKPFLQ